MAMATNKSLPAPTTLPVTWDHNCKHAMHAARTAGYCKLEDLLPFHRRLLRPDQPFR